MKKTSRVSETPATQWLRRAGIDYTEHVYDYVEHGGTSPFGLRKAMPVYVEASVLALPSICINGGRRGFLVGIAPSVLSERLDAKPVQCALSERE